MLCDYGCGNKAVFIMKNGKNSCSYYPSSCPAIRMKNSKANIGKHLGEKNHFYGKSYRKGKKAWNKGLTQETDDRVKKNSQSLKLYQKLHPDNRTGFKHTKAVKDRISNSMKGNRNANHRGDRQIYYKGIRMDSTWETVVAFWLDSQEVTWQYNERGYVLSNGSWYFPDFSIYVNNVFSHLLEVKGYFRKANKSKFEKFCLEYPDIVVELWCKDKLKALGLIDSSGYITKSILTNATYSNNVERRATLKTPSLLK